MHALKFVKPWQIDIQTTPQLTCLDADDVIVDVSICGICGTDVGIVSGDYPVAVSGVTLGHEACGIVTQIGQAVTQFSLGDRVVINPTYSCNECRLCAIGNPNHCEMKKGTEAGVSYDGAFAHQYRAKERFLIRLDDTVSMRAAALTEPLSCTITGVDKLDIHNPKVRAAVIGAGPMGMLYLWVLAQRGVTAYMIEKNEHRYQFAQDKLPTNAAIYRDFEEALQQQYGSKNAQLDVVIDTSGQLTELIFDQLAPGGKLLTVALKNKVAALDVLKIADKSLSIMGSIDSLNQSFERAYAMIRDGHVPAESLVSHEFALSEYQDAFRLIGCDIVRNTMIPLDTPNCKVLLRLSDAE